MRETDKLRMSLSSKIARWHAAGWLLGVFGTIVISCSEAQTASGGKSRR
jgi:hypothetical protein